MSFVKNVDWKKVVIGATALAVSAVVVTATGGLAAGAVVGALNLACGSLGVSIASGIVVGAIGGSTYNLVNSALSGNDAKTVFQDTLMGGFTGGIFGGFTGGAVSDWDRPQAWENSEGLFQEESSPEEVCVGLPVPLQQEIIPERKERTMDICIKKLKPEMAEKFLYYFDHDAFSDHEEWSACYCLQSHLSREEDENCILKEERRQKAKDLVQQGIMTGYLIYDGDKIVGWCNAGDKFDYAPVCANDEFFTDQNEKGRIKVLYCMDIAPGYRGKGIAKSVMERFLNRCEGRGISICRRVSIFRYKEGLSIQRACQALRRIWF